VPRHAFEQPRGRIDAFEIESEHLRANLLGDPPRRTVAVYLPQGYDESDRDYPLFVALAGFTGSGLRSLAWQSFGESLPQRIDRLVHAGAMGPAVFAFPDCFTSLGGNQYVDSSAMGRFASFLVDDVVPALETRYRIRRGRRHRALFGKSSGGFGALHHGMCRADSWGAIASHSGDCGFDILFRRDFPRLCDALAAHDSRPERFVASLAAKAKIGHAEMAALMLLAMAASFDPDPSAPLGIRLPMDPHTCELDHDRWSRWLAFDPLVQIEDPDALASLRSLAGLFVDCGTRDQFFIHYGTRVFVRRLMEAGVPHLYEEFPDDHSGIDYRLDRSLPYLHAAVTAA
jgi:hypothetical protein